MTQHVIDVTCAVIINFEATVQKIYSGCFHCLHCLDASTVNVLERIQKPSESLYAVRVPQSPHTGEREATRMAHNVYFSIDTYMRS